MSQKGRSKNSEGQGSRGIGAPAFKRFGEPGLSGECMSLLNRYKPPVGIPFIFSLNATAIGVGKVGIAGSLPFASLEAEVTTLDWELMGVFGEMSEPSSILETDKLRFFKFFRLDEEKFFRSPDPD
jgi:hypothetical protein